MFVLRKTWRASFFLKPPSEVRPFLPYYRRFKLHTYKSSKFTTGMEFIKTIIMFLIKRSHM